ncbi:hypothetical protein BDW59DRAFT_121100 [Aspergillus cavernicola]|uniref:N-acetylgalactosaminide beta-1,3-galactosyltransferase n=1 Tax=Aspergillus cavernicola TaxID=176166 RepID=A0ABR4HVS1_9EURO
MPFSLSQRAARRLYLLVSFLLLLHFYALYTRYFPNNNGHIYSINGSIPPDCPSLPGLDNVLLVLKTGVTEAHDKLPIHRNTTLRCMPNYIVWSDYEEQIADIPVHDVLYNESATLHQLPDFNLYTRVQSHGRDALTRTDLSDDVSTPFGKSNPGWKLDKWKFVPMIEHTFRKYDRADWYVFMEADTYIMWPAMMAWLAKLDRTQPKYLGNQMQIRDVIFAHGGSGFVLSRPAMERAAALLEEKRGYWDSITKEEWAGDCVLGILLKEAGVNLDWSWPMLQIAPPKELDHFGSNYGRTPWCYPAVSFHHLKTDDIRELSSLEKMWSVEGAPLLFRDVFFQLGRPRMSDVPVDGWDNEAVEEKKGVKNADECRAVCEKDENCLQYVLRNDGMCCIGRDARVGQQKVGYTSGWMLERIDRVAKKMGTCPRPEWIS